MRITGFGVVGISVGTVCWIREFVSLYQQTRIQEPRPLDRASEHCTGRLIFALEY